MKALVLSGGGSAGPFHLGVMEYLHARGNRYDLFVGVSVGALVAANMCQHPKGRATQALLKTRRLFLSVKTRNIWKHWSGGMLTAFLPWLKKESLYDSGPFERLVKRRLSRKSLQESGVKLLVGAVNLNTGKYETFDQDSPDIVKAVIASASYPVFFKPVKIGKDKYSDGGIRTVTPIQAAIDAGATEIDIITCVPPEGGRWDGGGMLSTAGRDLSLMVDEIVCNDLRLGIEMAREKGIKVRLWRPNKQVVKDPLEFIPKEARELYQAGYNHAHQNPEGIL